MFKEDWKENYTFILHFNFHMDVSSVQRLWHYLKVVTWSASVKQNNHKLIPKG